MKKFEAPKAEIVKVAPAAALRTSSGDTGNTGDSGSIAGKDTQYPF